MDTAHRGPVAVPSPWPSFSPGVISLLFSNTIVYVAPWMLASIGLIAL